MWIGWGCPPRLGNRARGGEWGGAAGAGAQLFISSARHPLPQTRGAPRTLGYLRYPRNASGPHPQASGHSGILPASPPVRVHGDPHPAPSARPQGHCLSDTPALLGLSPGGRSHRWVAPAPETQGALPGGGGQPWLVSDSPRCPKVSPASARLGCCLSAEFQ